ncbi:MULTISPECIES: regulatory iron-sulfur-containing complex subunit RicT [unclassified Desulfovibrio]|uniref:PSP1 domain-containing protein n=1 Tax=unclassified Desulfovibrio TaxID=2593640 RepID=UPI0013EAF163|nr:MULTISPECIES: regulatory iron-sulfur-containing complex subunit RicT [unclassified Desulfovibrio]
MSIFGIRYHALGQTEYYSAPDDCKPGDKVLVEADQGSALGEVVSGPIASLPGSSEADLPVILRMANAEDKETGRRNEALAREAMRFCKERIRERRLDMKLVDVEIFFDRSKFIFYFTAPVRIDFRELVKDLVREYRARIELRQIGVRHETQMLGAVGNCGMVCCCRRYLRKFAPVTIRMAKEQNLFLNPAKISGICGRLLCCLSYEQENYERFHRNSPRPGKKYLTSRGLLKVLRANMFRNSLSVLTEENEEVELTLEEWQELDPRRPDVGPAPAPEPRRQGERPGRESPQLARGTDPGSERAPAEDAADAAGPPRQEVAKAPDTIAHEHPSQRRARRHHPAHPADGGRPHGAGKGPHGRKDLRPGVSGREPASKA